MIGRIISLISIPMLLWMLIGGYRQMLREYNIFDSFEFLSQILFLIVIACGVISSFTYVFWGASLVLKLKYW